MEFPYFFSIIAAVAISIGVFTNIDTDSDNSKIASAYPIGTFSVPSVNTTPNPHN